jgi:uncharacterized protein
MLPNLKLSYYNFFIPHPERNIYIVYNSFANSMIKVGWDEGVILSKLNSMEIHYLNLDLIELLRQNGMIIPKEMDEFVEVKERAEGNRVLCEESSTLFLVITPTNTCNMSCPYCYQGDKSAKGSDTKYLSKENMDALKNLVHNAIYKPHAQPIKEINVEWFGGEPLVRKNIIEDFSDYVTNLADKNNIGYKAKIITNGTLLDAPTWDMLYRSRVNDIQITIDGNRDMHNQMRMYVSGKGTYDKILDNLVIMPENKFAAVIRINGDKVVFQNLPGMFDDLEARGIWPHRREEISFHWAPKFYNMLGFNQEKDVYYTSYEYQKSKHDFALLRLSRYNQFAAKHGLAPRKLRVAYPSFSEYYCSTVESPNSLSIDDGGFLHKCYNTINNKSRRIQHVSEFDPNTEGLNHYKKLDKTSQPDCRTCKVLPICEESCNMRFVDKVESKICSSWKYFMEEKMIAIYEQNFGQENPKEKATEIVARRGTASLA